MSTILSKTRVLAVAAALLGGTAVLAAVALGWLGYPPSAASATLPDRRPTAAALGVESDATIVLADKVDADERLSAVVAASETTVAASMFAPGKKRVTPRGRGGWKPARVSWYGPGFYGRRMASGPRLKRDSMVVAHRSLKFGTRIEFNYKGRTVIAVVKDRGPFIHGRVFDLGPGTAKALGFGGVGTVKYRVL